MDPGAVLIWRRGEEGERTGHACFQLEMEQRAPRDDYDDDNADEWEDGAGRSLREVKAAYEHGK